MRRERTRSSGGTPNASASMPLRVTVFSPGSACNGSSGRASTSSTCACASKPFQGRFASLRCAAASLLRVVSPSHPSALCLSSSQTLMAPLMEGHAYGAGETLRRKLLPLLLCWDIQHPRDAAAAFRRAQGPPGGGRTTDALCLRLRLPLRPSHDPRSVRFRITGL